MSVEMCDTLTGPIRLGQNVTAETPPDRISDRHHRQTVGLWNEVGDELRPAEAPRFRRFDHNR